MSDDSELKRIRKREERGGHGPWKWQLIDALTQVGKKLDALLTSREKLVERTETQRRLSEAGKKSAAARRAKFGSARPGDAMLKAFAGPPQMDLLTEEQIERPFGEPVREGVRAARKKSVKPPTAGSQVWQIYELAYQSRWKVAPLRVTRAPIGTVRSWRGSWGSPVPWTWLGTT